MRLGQDQIRHLKEKGLPASLALERTTQCLRLGSCFPVEEGVGVIGRAINQLQSPIAHLVNARRLGLCGRAA